LKSGTLAIALVGAVLVGCAIASAAVTSLTCGLGLFVVAAVVTALDARYATATHITIDERGVTLRYWMRTKTFEPKSVSILHDVPHGRLVLSRRGKDLALARFRDPRGRAVRAAVAAGVEVISY
jgi:hypothetical protein